MQGLYKCAHQVHLHSSSTTSRSAEIALDDEIFDRASAEEDVCESPRQSIEPTLAHSVEQTTDRYGQFMSLVSPHCSDDDRILGLGFL